MKVYFDKKMSSSVNLKLAARFGARATTALEEADVFVCGMAWTKMCSIARLLQIPVVKEEWLIESAMQRAPQPTGSYLSRPLENVRFAYANLNDLSTFEELVKSQGGVLLGETKEPFDILIYNPKKQCSTLSVAATFKYRCPAIPEVDFYSIMDGVLKHGKPLQFSPDSLFVS